MTEAEKRELKLIALVASELGKIAKEVPAAKARLDDLQALMINYLAG